MPPARRPPARTRLDVDARRAQLLALGVEAFATRAYDDVPIDEIARAAGVSKGLLFHYFPSKRHFYTATIREAANQLLAQTLADHVEDPLARLYAGLDAFLAYVDRHGPAYSALLRGGIGSDPDVLAIVEETRGVFLARLMQGLPSSDAPGPLLRTALRAWLGFVEAAALEWIDHRDVPPAKLRDLMVAVLVTVTTPITAPAAPSYTPQNRSRRSTKT